MMEIKELSNSIDIKSCNYEQRHNMFLKLEDIDLFTLNDSQVENLKQFVLCLKLEEQVSFYADLFKLDYYTDCGFQRALLTILIDKRFKELKKSLTYKT
jgi:hypothetical protein